MKLFFHKLFRVKLGQLRSKELYLALDKGKHSFCFFETCIRRDRHSLGMMRSH